MRQLEQPRPPVRIQALHLSHMPRQSFRPLSQGEESSIVYSQEKLRSPFRAIVVSPLLRDQQDFVCFEYSGEHSLIGTEGATRFSQFRRDHAASVEPEFHDGCATCGWRSRPGRG